VLLKSDLNIFLMSKTWPKLYLVTNGLNNRVWSYGIIIVPAGFTGQGVLNKDITVWLDGATSTQIKEKKMANLVVSEIRVLQNYFWQNIALENVKCFYLVKLSILAGGIIK
jgi:hypothetical protein